MKVFGRIIVKLMVVLLIAAAAAAGAVGWRTYQRSDPGYIMDQYLTCLIDNDSRKAYGLLDQSGEAVMTQAQYEEALTGKRYSLSSEFTVSELQKRTDNDGNEYVDFHAEFKSASGETQLEDDFVVKKQEGASFGMFDRWKVMSGHCMVKDLRITVPAGSQVYLDNEPLDPLWIVRDDIPLSRDCYRIPSLAPGRKSLVIRHSELEAVNTTIDTNNGDQDYCAQMTMKRAAQEECESLAVSALKQFYAAAVKEKTDALEDVFKACLDQAKQSAQRQGRQFHRENSVFQGVGISEFVPQYGDLVYAEGEDSALTVEVTLKYHYAIREDVTEDTGEVYDDGTPIQETVRNTDSGDSTARFVMAYRDGAWSVETAEIPLIPTSEAENGTSGSDTENGISGEGTENGTSADGTENGTSGGDAENGTSGDGTENGTSGEGTENGETSGDIDNGDSQNDAEEGDSQNDEI